MAWHVVIAGGGFGGFYAARTLERIVPPHSTKITLVNDVNFMLYTPLLPGAAAGTLEPRHVVVPLREQLERTDLLLGTICGGEPARKVLEVSGADGSTKELHYDQLVVAVGSVTRTLNIPGLAEHGVGFKSLPEAIALRNRLIRCLEAAEAAEDDAEREGWLTFVFVGAGYAGLEGLAELQDCAADLLDLYPRCRAHGIRFLLVEAKERVMTEIPERLSEYASRELRGRGIEIRTNTTLQRVTATEAHLSGDEVVRCRSVVWTAGVKPHPVVERLGLPTDRGGRIVVDRTMKVEGADGVWAIGDAAAVPDPAKDGKASCPPTAQHAIRQGRLVARNVAATLGSGKVKPFRYKTRGVFVDMGQRKAVAQTTSITWHGAAAWWMARTYHLVMMPGLARKARLLIDWNVGLLFGRDASELGRLGHPPALEAASTGGTSDQDAMPAVGAKDQPVPAAAANGHGNGVPSPPGAPS